MVDPVRICVIGNSHMAALRDGWPLVEADHPGLRLSFFGQGKYALRHIEAVGTRLIQPDPVARQWMYRATGVDAIETEGYDGYLLVGLWPHLRWLEAMLSVTSIVGLEGLGRMLVSFEAALAAANDAIAHTPLPHVTRLLRGIWGDPPIYAVPMPRLGAEALLPDAPTAAFGYPQSCRHAIDGGTAGRWRPTMDRLMAGFAGPLPVLLDQPETTIQDHILTRPEFRRGAPRLERDLGPQPPEDFNHMNAAYGAKVIEAIAPRLVALD